MPSDGKGYALPEVIDPGAFQCIKVYIPDDTLYHAAFWNAYRFFGTWLAWERDDEHRGADAAAVWVVAFNLARAEWEAHGGCGMSYELRQNPDDPCELQQSIDGGETWTLVFDYSLCQRAVTVPAPYPGSETGAEDAAAALLRDIFIQTVNLIDDTPDKPTFIDEATGVMRLYDPGFANPGALALLYDVFTELDPEVQITYTEECVYVPKFEELSECFSPEGVLDYLECWSELIGEWLDDTSDAVMQALSQVANTLTGNGLQTAAGGGGGGGAGFGEGCTEWCATLDFTVGTFGFAPVWGDYYAAVGFSNDPFGGTPEGCSATLDLPYYVNITHVDMSFYSGGPAAGYQGAVIGYDGGDLVRNNALANVGGTLEWDGNTFANLLGFSVNISADSPISDITVYQMTVCGIGPNPFE